MRHHPAAVVMVVGSLLVCTGCGTPPWQEQRAAPISSPSPSVSSAASASASATPARPATPAATATTAAPAAPTTAAINDLATGSAKRKLDAGGVRLSINYWSTLPMTDWTRTAAKPLNLSASAKFIDGSKQDIFLSKVSVNIEVQGPKGALTGPAPLVDQASLDPGYLIRSPSSYGQVFTIPTVAPQARSVTLALTYELLAQTAPKAKTYAKQTASDTLTIPIQS
jgi:hypothetical protein